MPLCRAILPSSADVAFTTPSLPTIAVSIMSPTLISTTREITPLCGKYTRSTTPPVSATTAQAEIDDFEVGCSAAKMFCGRTIEQCDWGIEP